MLASKAKKSRDSRREDLALLYDLYGSDVESRLESIQDKASFEQLLSELETEDFGSRLRLTKKSLIERRTSLQGQQDVLDVIRQLVTVLASSGYTVVQDGNMHRRGDWALV